MTMCNVRFQEQNELLESTNGECEQIICTHGIEEETPQPQVKKRKRIQTKIVVLAFGKVPVKEPFQIMKVEEKTETFKGVTSKKLHMALRKKGEQNTQVVRCSGTIAKASTG